MNQAHHLSDTLGCQLPQDFHPTPISIVLSLQVRTQEVPSSTLPCDLATQAALPTLSAPSISPPSHEALESFSLTTFGDDTLLQEQVRQLQVDGTTLIHERDILVTGSSSHKIGHQLLHCMSSP